VRINGTVGRRPALSDLEGPIRSEVEGRTTILTLKPEGSHVEAGEVVCELDATTLIAAIIARASVKGALFAVLSFPLLVPLLVVAIQGTALALQGEGWEPGAAPLQVLIAYTVALFVASLFLFGSVWEA